jgi:Transposase, Mutator family
VCNSKLQKRSKTAAGAQRWHCLPCNRSSTKPRQDLGRAFLLERFVSWLMGKPTYEDLSIPGRTFRKQIAWCWGVAPVHILNGEIHHAVIVDGIRVGGRVCLIARTTKHVIAWLWVDRENSQSWTRLFQMLPAPSYVVCDGQKGMLKALGICWPDTIIQRCRFHAWLNIKSKLTLHPASVPSKELLQLGRDLLHLHSKREARRWKRRLHRWHKKHHSYIDARTTKQDPEPRKRSWRYTHARTRSTYKQLHKIQDDLLRSVYRPKLQLPATTNHVEGGINSPIRTKLRLHRGMPPAHQMRLVDWYLYSRTEDPKPPRYCL